MVGFGSLWTFSSGLYCFFFTLHFSVPEISFYIKSACLLPPTYKFCTYYGTKSVLSACRFFVIFTRICNFCNVFRRFLAIISFTRLPLLQHPGMLPRSAFQHIPWHCSFRFPSYRCLLTSSSSQNSLKGISGSAEGSP